MPFLAALRKWVGAFTASRDLSSCVPTERILAFTDELDGGGLLTRIAHAEQDAISLLGVIRQELEAIEVALDDACECKKHLRELRHQLQSLFATYDRASDPVTGERTSLAPDIVGIRMACRCMKIELQSIS